MLTIGPDPARPHGGHAIISLDQGEVDGAEVTLSIRNGFNEKYLGEAGWQSVKAYFGPYQLETRDGRAQFVVGTEIVNGIEEYTPLVLEIGGREFTTSWPDDIMPGPSAATIGGVAATPQVQGNDTGPILVGSGRVDGDGETASPGSEAGDAPETAVETTEASGQDEAQVDAASGSRMPMILGGVLVVAILLGGAAYWYLSQNDPPPDPEPVPEEPVEEPVPEPEPEPVPEPVVVADPCALDALAELAVQGHAVLLEGLTGCGGSVSADTALGLIERGVAADDPVALLTLGQLYDGDVEIDVIETEMGLTFGDNAARAAEYYARARDAGDGVGAAEALATVCGRLGDASDTLSQSAFEDYCQ